MANYFFLVTLLSTGFVRVAATTLFACSTVAWSAMKMQSRKCFHIRPSVDGHGKELFCICSNVSTTSSPPQAGVDHQSSCFLPTLLLLLLPSRRRSLELLLPNDSQSTTSQSRFSLSWLGYKKPTQLSLDE